MVFPYVSTPHQLYQFHLLKARPEFRKKNKNEIIYLVIKN